MVNNGVRIFFLVSIFLTQIGMGQARIAEKSNPDLNGMSKEQLVQVALQPRWDRDLAAIQAAQQMPEEEKIRFLLQVLASECKNPTNESPENPLPEHWKPAYTLSASIQGFIFDYLAFPKEVIHKPGGGYKLIDKSTESLPLKLSIGRDVLKKSGPSPCAASWAKLYLAHLGDEQVALEIARMGVEHENWLIRKTAWNAIASYVKRGKSIEYEKILPLAERASKDKTKFYERRHKMDVIPRHDDKGKIVYPIRDVAVYVTGKIKIKMESEK